MAFDYVVVPLMGVSINRIAAMTFAIGSSLAALAGILLFHRIGRPLDLRQRPRIDQRFQGKKLLEQIGAHRGLVIVGLPKIKSCALGAHGAILRFQSLAGPK